VPRFFLREASNCQLDRTKLKPSPAAPYFFCIQGIMKDPVASERSRGFKRAVALAASLALFLALLLLGFYYGCAKSSRPERPSAPPLPSGMSARAYQVDASVQLPEAIFDFVSQFFLRS
jgi:hypothetical protein